MKKTKKYKSVGFLWIFSVSFILLANSSITVLATTTQMSQSIDGALDIAIVDNNGDAVSDPEVVFPTKSFSMTYQSSDATLGTSSERLRVTNPSGSTDTWTLSIAATGGTTALWTSGTNSYDFNDSTASAVDGADADSVGGQMAIDPSAGTITGIYGTSITNVSKGTSLAFVEGTKNSIDLMTASSGASKPGQWDLTGIDVSQTIPGAQAAGSYTIDMTITAT